MSDTLDMINELNSLEEYISETKNTFDNNELFYQVGLIKTENNIWKKFCKTIKKN